MGVPVGLMITDTLYASVGGTGVWVGPEVGVDVIVGVDVRVG